MGTVIDMHAVAQAIEADVHERAIGSARSIAIASLEPSLTPEGPALTEACARAGVVFNRVAASSGSIERFIAEKNRDTAVHGILVNGFGAEADPHYWRDAIVPDKDVAGAGPMSAGRALTGKSRVQPVAAAWPVAAAEATGLNLWGARATVLGRGDARSRTLAMILVDKRATTTYVNVNNKAEVDLSEADVLFAAADRSKIVKPDRLKEGCVIIEISPGDVDPAAFETAAHYLFAPQRTNPLAIALLLRNCLELPRGQ